jgi:L-2-hydroxyglutarate oxidase LhgO
MRTRHDVLIVGGGIIGLATARALLRARPGLGVLVVDKEDTVGRHQTGHNSGVLHSGIYYTPGSLKARLCLSGKAAMERYAAEHAIPYARVGKLIVAVDDAELERLDDLKARAEANGVPDVRIVEPDQIAEIEPRVVGRRALHAPHTAVIDYRAVSSALADEVHAAGGEVRVGVEVLRVEARPRGVAGVTREGEIEAATMVGCAGLQSDRLAQRSGLRPSTRIIPFRGDYYTLVGAAAAFVNGLVYPVPDPAFPFLGVHFTRKIDGTTVAGPNAVLALAREGYRRTAFRPRDAIEALSYPGILRFVRRHGGVAAQEVWRDVSKRAFLADMQRYVPDVEGKDAVFGPSGVRAQAMRRDGTLVDDFVIEGRERMMHVLNAPSPGATASLAIGEEIANRAFRELL